MTTRNLDALFQPRSVAVIGASERPGSVGRVLTENLRESFGGPVFLVNPKHRSLFGIDAFPSVDRLPEAPDLAILATPPASIPGLVRELAERGTLGVCVITAGVGEEPRAGRPSLRQEMLEAAGPKLQRIVGPNCLGIQVPGHGLNASFAHVFPEPGSIAFVAQSGALITAVLDWAHPRGIGFSHIVSMGDMADVDFGDMLDYLANDPSTRAILLYIEAITNARKFMSAARAASRSKPVIVVKAGRHEQGARAAQSHTGALAGQDDVYDAAFRRAGMLRVLTLEQLFDAVETLATARLPRGDRLTILTNGGGAGVLATDALISEGMELARLSDSTVERLNQCLPSTWSHGNPVDIIGDAGGRRYAAALDVLLGADDSDGVLILNCPTAVASPTEVAEAVVGPVSQEKKKTVLTCWIGDQSAQEPRRRFREQGVPTYESPEDAVHAFAQMVEYQRNQEQLMETPPSSPRWFEPSSEHARRLVETALAEGREWLTAAECKGLLEAYEIPVVRSEVVSDLDELEEVARGFAGEVAIKIVSADITHKSDVGGVRLAVDPARAKAVASTMWKTVQTARPDARLQGFTVQEMVSRPHAIELIAGMLNDVQFGPVILFGRGGTAVELLEDEALALPPLNLKLARELIARTRVHRLLQGYRHVPPADLGEIERVLVCLSHLIVDLPEIEEMDINPLLADRDGVLALDARIRVRPAEASGASRLAIRPYPKELEETVELEDGTRLWLRPIVPEDEPSLRSAFGRLSREDVRNRFFVPLRVLDHVMAARFTQIDYDRQMALVLTDPGPPGRTEIHGVVRLIEDPDRTRAEFAIVVARRLSGRGIGTALLRRVIDYARSRGVVELYGDVLRDNGRMLALCDRLGFSRHFEPGSSGVIRVRMDLQPPPGSTGDGEESES